MGKGWLAEEAHRRRIKIAIDGPAGAGKSTVGKGVADVLDCAYLDTGLMYRAVTWLALQTRVAVDDSSALSNIAEQTRLVPYAGNRDCIMADDQRLCGELREAPVDAAVSAVSAHAPVRTALVRQQRVFASGRCAVLVGRDIGTTVLPEAEVKLWVTASPGERARRRRAERSADLDLARAEAAIEERDRLDATRAVSPLRRAADAVVLDTDHMDARASVSAALDVVREKLLLASSVRER